MVPVHSNRSIMMVHSNQSIMMVADQIGGMQKRFWLKLSIRRYLFMCGVHI